jgi:hypothetical protein
MAVLFDIPDAYIIHPFSIASVAPVLSRRDNGNLPSSGLASTRSGRPPPPEIRKAPPSPVLDSKVVEHGITHNGHTQTVVHEQSVEDAPPPSQEEDLPEAGTGVITHHHRTIKHTTHRHSIHRSASMSSLSTSQSVSSTRGTLHRSASMSSFGRSSSRLHRSASVRHPPIGWKPAQQGG